MKEVKKTTDVVVDVVKIIEEEVTTIHQIMKEQVKTQVPQEHMEDDTSQGKTKRGGMTNLKFNVIIETNMVIMLTNIEVLLIIRKDKLTMLKRKIKKNLLFCWHIKRESEMRNTWYHMWF